MSVARLKRSMATLAWAWPTPGMLSARSLTPKVRLESTFLTVT